MPAFNDPPPIPPLHQDALLSTITELKDSLARARWYLDAAHDAVIHMD